MILTGPIKQATSGSAKSLVIFVHGYGADGEDLIGLADTFAPVLPDTIFAAPNAPEVCSGNPEGLQWFPIPWLDGTAEGLSKASMGTSIDKLNTYLDEIAVETGIAPAQTFLVGFSQGTMMALHIGLRRSEALAGIIGFSGMLLHQDKLQSEIVSKPPVLLVHGDQDAMVPPSSMPEAANVLRDVGVSVGTHVSEGMGHGIAPDGLNLAYGFILKNLGSG